MNNTLNIFNFENNEVHTEMSADGTVWFNANDVCNILGYKNSRDALKQHVDTPYVAKYDAWVVTGKKSDGTDALRKSQVNYVNEFGLYALILGSKLPNAIKFKRWVFEEVLPSIRKTGSYTLEPKELDVESMLLIALETERERKRLALINKEQEAKIQQDAPKVQMAEDFLIVDDAISMEAMAKLLCNIEGVSIGRTKLYNKLREWEVVMPNTTTPYQKFITSELFACREKRVERSNGTVEIKISTTVTPKGQLALIKKVRKLLNEGTWSN